MFLFKQKCIGVVFSNRSVLVFLFKQKCIDVSFQTEMYLMFSFLCFFVVVVAFFRFCIYFIDGLISKVAVERASQYIIILTCF